MAARRARHERDERTRSDREQFAHFRHRRGYRWRVAGATARRQRDRFPGQVSVVAPFAMQAPARRKRAGADGSVLAFIFLAANTLAAESTDTAAQEAPLQFRITQGSILNAFHQQGPVAAHLLLSDGTHPRLLVAFPAGNSGAGIWFENTQQPVHWTLANVSSASRADERGRTLHGIVADVSIDALVVVRDAVLSSVRVLRDYQSNGTYPAEV